MNIENLTGLGKRIKSNVYIHEQKDTISKYNLFLNVRNNNDYPHNNLFVIVSMNEPGVKY